MRFERELVFVKTDLGSKEEVVEFLGRQLVQAGAVDPGYVEAMHVRERDFGTYITEGIAIPHGTEKSRDMVKRAALAVVKVPQGIEWLPGKMVYLAFGIAGNNDDHVALLGCLATFLMDDVQKEKLLAADTADVLFTYLDENHCE